MLENEASLLQEVVVLVQKSVYLIVSDDLNAQVFQWRKRRG